MTGERSIPRPAAKQALYPSAGVAWYGICVLTLIYIFSFIDRQVLALLVEPIKRDLHISDVQIGMLQGLAFAILYTFLGLPIAWLSDRFSRRGIIAVGLIVWSAMATCCGLARSVGQLFVARIGVGVGEAALSPAAYSIIMDSFPRPRLGRAFAVYNVGVPLGAGIALLLGGIIIGVVSAPGSYYSLPILGEVHAWQLVLISTGLPGLLLPLLLFTFREPRRHEASLPASAPKQALQYFNAHKRLYIPHFVAQALLAMTGYAISAWLPTALARAHEIRIADVGKMMGLATILMNTTGMLIAGLWCDRLSRRGSHDAPLIVAMCSAVGIACLSILPPLAPTLPLVWISMFVAGLPMNANVGVGPLAVNQVTPNRFRARMSALYLLTVNLIGLGCGPTLVPWLNERLFHDPAKIRFSLAIVVFSGAVISIILLQSIRAAYRVHFVAITSDRAPEAESNQGR